MDPNQLKQYRRTAIANTILRFVVCVNLVLISLSFSTWFSGTPDAPGWADSAFGGVSLTGWRFDVAWLLISSLVLFFVFLYSLATFARRSAKINATLTLLALVGFYFYARYQIHAGLLYMGIVFPHVSERMYAS